MKRPLLLFTLDLLLTAAAVAAITSCSMLAQKGNCFGPPDPSAMQAHQAFTAKLALP